MNARDATASGSETSLGDDGSDDVELLELGDDADSVVDLVGDDADGDSSGDEDDDEHPMLPVSEPAPMPRRDNERSGTDEEEDEDLPLSLAAASRAPTTRKRRRLRRHDEHDEAAADGATDAITTSSKSKSSSATTTTTRKPIVVIKPQPTECTVCYDPCTNAGRHRLVALKCGHVFGKRCIERWVQERKTCPNCSIAVRKGDIRALFTDHVAVVDTSGIEDWRQKCEGETARRVRAETELARSQLLLELAQAEVVEARAEATRWQRRAAELQSHMASSRRSSELLKTSPDTCVGGGSQLFSPPRGSQSQSQSFTGMTSSPAPLSSAHDGGSQRIDHTQGTSTSTTPGFRELFRVPLQRARVCRIAPSASFVCVGDVFSPTSHGLIKISTSDPRHTIRLPAHTSAVRDVRISQREDLALTVAFDGKLAITNLNSQSVVLQLPLPPSKRNGWSCALSAVDPFAVFCGFHDGTIAKYDMRRPTAAATPVGTYALPVQQPVHAIHLIPSAMGGGETLVAATFNVCGVWTAPGAPTSAAEPITLASVLNVPTCCSVAVAQTKPSKMLLTARNAASQGNSSEHSVYSISPPMQPAPAREATVTGFRTPAVLSRSAIWAGAQGQTTVASWDNEQRQVLVWDVAAGQSSVRSQVPVTQGPVVDLQHCVAGGDWRRGSALLGLLSTQQLVLYADEHDRGGI